MTTDLIIKAHSLSGRR